MAPLRDFFLPHVVGKHPPFTHGTNPEFIATPMPNFHLAQRSLHLAIVLRDSARWHAQRGFPDAAATCRTRMRLAAKATIDSVRAVEAVAGRQTARDVTSESFAPLAAPATAEAWRAELRLRQTLTDVAADTSDPLEAA